MSRNRILPFAAVVLLWIVSCPLLTAWQSEPQQVASVEGVTEYRLENGARVLLFPEASQPTLTVNMTVLVGSRHEGYGEAGMAHLLEHMVFKGTPSIEDVPRALRDHGARFNGTTNADRTNYFETLPATEENLEFAIQLEADRLVNSYVRHEDLISEFTVVRNEFERGENSPQGVLSQRVTAAAYEWHNYGKSTIGNRSDIERVPIDRLKAFYRKFYQPDNVVMVITGRFDRDRALQLANKYLGSIPAPERKLDATYTEEPPQDGQRYVELRRVGEIGSLTAACHIPAAAHEDWAPLSILASVLSEDKVGLLEQALVETGLATGASARCRSTHDPGLFFMSVQPAEGKLDQSRDILTEIMDGLANAEFTQQAVDRAKKRAQRRTENLLVDASMMGMALSGAASLGDWRLLFLQRDRVAEVTVDDVNRVARTYFPAHNRTVGMFIPTDEPKRMHVPVVASIEEVVRDYQGGETVAAGEAFDSSPENIDSRTGTLEIGGVQVAMLTKETRDDRVNVSLVLRYGNEQSLAGKTRAAAMVASMLMAGTNEMDRRALQQKMADLGVRISTGGGRGRRRGGRGGGGMSGSPGQLSFSIQAKKESLNDAIALLGEILHDPAFPQDDFDQMKMRFVNAMKSMQSEPQMQASNLMSRSLSHYPKGDVRYVPTIEETIEEFNQLSLNDVIEVYQDQLSTASGEIAIVGDFDPDSAQEALTAVLKDWKSDIEFQPIVREALTDLTGSKSDIHTPDKANAVFMAGLVFPMNDEHPDTEALTLGNFILGGGTLSSRLGDRIRQKEGLSYGVSSSIRVPSKGTDARFMINAITNPDNIDAVENAAVEELTRFIQDGPTEKEIADAKTAWLETQKVSRSSDRSVAGQLRSHLYLDRTFKHVSDLEARIAALTPGDVQAAFQTYIDPEKLVIIRGGDFE